MITGRLGPFIRPILPHATVSVIRVLSVRTTVMGMRYALAIPSDMREAQRRAARGKRERHKDRECTAEDSPHSGRITGAVVQ